MLTKQILNKVYNLKLFNFFYSGFGPLSGIGFRKKLLGSATLYSKHKQDCSIRALNGTFIAVGH